METRDQLEAINRLARAAAKLSSFDNCTKPMEKLVLNDLAKAVHAMGFSARVDLIGRLQKESN